MRRALKIFTVLSILLLLLGGGVAFLLTTHSGLQLGVRLANHFLAGKLTIASIDGSLKSPLAFEDVRYEDASLTLTIRRLTLQWQPSALLQKKLRIDQLHIEQIRVMTTPSAPAEPSQPLEKLPDIKLPLDIEVANATIIDTHISNTVIDTISLTGAYENNELRLRKLAATLPGIQVSINGKLRPQANYPGDINVEWQWQSSGIPAVAGKSNIKGDLDRADITASFSSPAAAELIATIREPLKEESWQAMLTLPATDLASIDPRLPLGTTTLSLKGSGTWTSIEGLAHIESEYLQQPLLADATVRYENTKLNISQLILQLPNTNSRLQSSGTIGTQPLQLSLSGQWRNLGWPLQDLSLVNSTTGSFTFRGNPQNYQLFTKGNLQGQKIPPTTWSLEGKGTAEQLNVRSLHAHLVDNGTITTTGTVSWKPSLGFKLKGNWHDFQWPLQRTKAVPTYASKAGNFQISGSTKNYSFNIDSEISGSQIPSTSIAMQGHGDMQHVVLSSLIANTLEGTLRGDASLSWQPNLAWRANIAAHALNPGVFQQDWPGKISAALFTEGEVLQGQISGQATIANLAGELRGLPLHGTASIGLANNRYTLDPVVMSIGDAHLSAAGDISDQWNLSWALDAANLHAFAPSASGLLTARGSLIGPREMPRIIMDLQGDQLAYSSYRAGDIAVDADIDLVNARDSRIVLHATEIQAGAQIKDLSVQAMGRLDNHQLKFSADLPQLSAAMVAQGGYFNGGIWAGTLDKSLISNNSAGTWQLAQPAALFASKNIAHTGQWCWNQVQNPGGLCGYVSWLNNGRTQGNLSLTEIPLALLKPFMPLDTQLQGVINGHATVEATAGGDNIGTIEITSDQGEVIYQPGTVREVRASFNDAIIAAHMENNLLNTAFSTNLSNQGQIGGFLSTTVAADKTGDRSLDGRLYAQFPSLVMVPAFFSGIDSADGSFLANLKIAGTSNLPLIDGYAEIAGGHAVLLRQGLNLEDISLKLTAQQSKINLDGNVKSGDGNLRLQGDAQMANADLNLRLGISGDSFKAMDTAEYRVYISPDVAINIANRNIDINGTIAIPQADLTPHDLKGTVEPSEDVVFVEEIQPQQTNSWNLRSLLRFELGERVKFKGFGLQGQLLGTLVIIDNPQQLTSALGEIRIEGGQYKAYGQDLVIERGRILFVGGPIADPGVDVRAVRKTEEVTAGVNVRGPLRSPTLTIFSNPQVSEQDALAYLLLGRPLGEASTEEGQRLYKAATSLGVAGGGYLAKQIGKQFGIEDVSIETGGEYKEPTLVIGKYLSPRLYIGYGLGLVEQFNSLRLRYRLSSKWTLEADSGRTSGADLLYTLEVN